MCMQQRAKLFFTQKIFNMGGMIVGAISPALISVLWRWTSNAEVTVPCEYIYHEASNDTVLLHGTKPDQLLYVDDEAHGVQNKTAEFCLSGQGDFCYEVCLSSRARSHAGMLCLAAACCTSEGSKSCGVLQQLFANGTHYWYEQSIKTIETTCAGQPGTTPLTMDRYEMSSLSSAQLGYLLTAVVFGFYHLLTMRFLVSKTTERKVEKKEQLPLVSSIMRSLNNAAFRPLLGAWALDGLILAALVTMFPFYIRYVIQPEGIKAQEKGQKIDASVRCDLLLVCMSTPEH
jgi:hypothetical protein